MSARRLAAPLRRDAVARLVRDKIADGTLKPGAPVPSGAALAREAGCHVITCRAALAALLADGTLARGPSRGARLRVGTAQGSPGAEADALRQRLSRELAARRRAAGLTQPELAKLLGVSVTSVGHAETSRVWQSRAFWERADGVLLADGALLRLHDDHQAAAVRPTSAGSPVPSYAAPAPVLPASVSITPDGVAVTWPDGTRTVARPPGWREWPAAPGPATSPPLPADPLRCGAATSPDDDRAPQRIEEWPCLQVADPV